MSGDRIDETSRPNESGFRSSQTLVLPRGASRPSIEAALDVLGREGGSDQSQPWTPRGFELERDRQIQILSDWATDESLWLPAASLGQRHSGRMEHAVFGIKQAGGFVFKATKGPKFGFWPFLDSEIVSIRMDETLLMRPATPWQYFSRLALLETLSPELNQFEGFSMIDGHFSVITSQLWYPSRNATWPEISRWLSELGFLPVRSDVYEDPTRWYHPEQNLALFDVGQSNVIFSDGKLVPIDIIPMHPEGPLLSCLMDFAARSA